MNRFLIVTIALALAFLSCAKEVAPPGGPPDITPPSILQSLPADGDTMVALTGSITIQFSERVNPKSATSALFISPLLKEEPRVRVKSDKLIITPVVPFDSGRTYVVSLGASLSDLNGNRMTSSKSIAFSTGHALDSATLTGYVYNQLKPETNLRVFAYKTKDILFDSLFALTPEYITECGANGHFEFKNMLAGKYLLIGVEDKDRDNKINSESERIALPVFYSTAVKEGTSKQENYLFESRYDSTELAVVSCIGSIGSISIQLIGGKLDPATLSTDSIQIIGNGGTKFTPQWATIFDQEGDKLHLWSESLAPDSTYSVTVAGLATQGGAYIKSDRDTCVIRIKSKDQTRPSILSRNPIPTRSLIEASETLSVLFSEPVMIPEDAAKIVVDSVTSIKLTQKNIGPTGFAFIAQDTLRPNRKLKFLLDQSKVHDIAGNSPADSIYTFDLTVTSGDSLGTLSGAVNGTDLRDVIVSLQGINRKINYTFRNLAAGHYSWSLYPDSYLLSAYSDQNHNDKWDLGTLIPFKFSEPGWIVQDTVKIRARFEREDFDLDFK